MTERRIGLNRVQVAATLRRMREEASVARDTVADALGCTVSKISDIETGRSGVKPVELERLLDIYRVNGDERSALIETARASRSRRRGMPFSPEVPAGHRRLADLEAQAVSAIYYSPELISGVLQTPAYARAVLECPTWYDPNAVERRIALRRERAKILIRADRPPVAYWCILGEAALHANVGGPTVMHEQLEHLLHCARNLENLVTQVLPLGSGQHLFMGMTATLLRFAPPAPDIMHVDIPERDRFSDREAEVASIAKRFELLKAKALGREESLDLIARVAGKYKEKADA